MCQLARPITAVCPLHISNTSQPLKTKDKLTLKRRRAIRFAPSDDFTDIQPCSSMTEQERSDIWFNEGEIESFKTDARMLSRAIRLQQQRCKKHNVSQYTPSKTLYFRGLETRINIERQRRRRMSIRAVLEAQRQLEYYPLEKQELQLAHVSNQLSNWSKIQAHLVGLTDAQSAAVQINLDNHNCRPQTPPLISESEEQSVKRFREEFMDIFPPSNDSVLIKSIFKIFFEIQNKILILEFKI